MATPPILKSRPKRAIVILVSVLFAFIVSLLIILVQDYFSRMRAEHRGTFEKYAWVAEQLKRDLKSIKPGK
jgi:hypothetical protein